MTCHRFAYQCKSTWNLNQLDVCSISCKMRNIAQFTTVHQWWTQSYGIGNCGFFIKTYYSPSDTLNSFNCFTNSKCDKTKT